MKWPFRCHDDADARLAEARARAEAAAREVEVSRQRQESVRKHVVEPLRKYAEHNQFASLIEATLREDHGRRP